MPTPTSPAAPPNQEEAVGSVLTALRTGPVRPSDVSKLSDLNRGAAQALASAWSSLSEATRVDVVQEMNALAEDRLDINFGRALRVALDDASPEVRQLAIRALWEDDASDLAERLLGLLDADPAMGVRVEAARALARFADAAVETNASSPWADRLSSGLINAASNDAEPSIVQCAALEAVAVFSEKAGVERLILDAYDSGELEREIGAIHAMGRSGNERWLDAAMDALERDDPEVRFEAARACGRLLDQRALPQLRQVAEDEDAEVRHAAISAIAQIGGKEGRRLLLNLAEDASEADAEIIEDALEEATGDGLDGAG